MQRQQTGRVAGIVLAILWGALLSAVAMSGDTPIVILDGSLTVESAVPWDQFTGSGDLRSHPEGTKSVTKVEVTMPGKNQTVNFAAEQCEVSVTYAGKDIKFSTGRNGKGLSITPFSAFQRGNSPNRLAHKNQSVKISHVTVTKAGTKVFDADAAGGTKIVISYQ